MSQHFVWRLFAAHRGAMECTSAIKQIPGVHVSNAVQFTLATRSFPRGLRKIDEAYCWTQHVRVGLRLFRGMCQPLQAMCSRSMQLAKLGPISDRTGVSIYRRALCARTNSPSRKACKMDSDHGYAGVKSTSLSQRSLWSQP